jgi:phosphoenolpyruvate synthase/pyruvate phosphate dikinase
MDKPEHHHPRMGPCDLSCSPFREAKRQMTTAQTELNAQERSRDSLAQVMGYWLLQHRDVYRAISKLRYMRTTPITEDEQKTAEATIDRLSHEWNRTQSAFDARTKDIVRLRLQVNKAKTSTS